MGGVEYESDSVYHTPFRIFGLCTMAERSKQCRTAIVEASHVFLFCILSALDRIQRYPHTLIDCPPCISARHAHLISSISYRSAALPAKLRRVIALFLNINLEITNLPLHTCRRPRLKGLGPTEPVYERAPACLHIISSPKIQILTSSRT